MSITLYNKIAKPTYQYTSPVKFKDVVYWNSKSLVDAFLNNWDDALTKFKCGDFHDFWNIHVDTDEAVKAENKHKFEEIYNAMWDFRNHVNDEVLFTKAIHYFEPALKEIPCFIDSDSLSLWEGMQFRYFFRRELNDEKQAYLMGLMCSNLKSDWERKYHKSEEDILYACHLIKEKIFSLYGYEGKEDAFLKLLSDKTEAEERTQENCIKAYQCVADRLYRENEFYYTCWRCTSLEEFAKRWRDKCAKWSKKEWDTFIGKLYEEKDDEQSFLPWLLIQNENTLYNRLKDWKGEVQENLIPEKESSELPASSFARRWLPSLLSIWTKSKQGEICSKETLLKKTDEFEEGAEGFHEKVKQMSKRRRMEDRKLLYMHIYQYLEEAFGQMPQFETTALCAELDSSIQAWKEWEEENQKYYEDKKVLARALRSNDLLSCWNYHFSDNPNVGNIRQELVLITCAPIEGSYQKNCEAFLQLLDTRGNGCTCQEISVYFKMIWDYIYVPLVEKSAKPDAATKETIDEMLEYYFRFLEKLAEKAYERLPKWIYDMRYDDQLAYRKALFQNHQIQEITSAIENCNRFDENTWERNIEPIQELPPKREGVNYIPFFRNSEAYKKREEQRFEILRIKGRCKAISNVFEQLKREWVEYVHKNYSRKSIAELHKAGEDKVREALEYQNDLMYFEKKWKLAVAAMNEQCEILAKERKQYEEDWDKKGGKIKDTKRNSFAEKAKKFFTH